MSGTLSFSLDASGDKATRRFGWSGGQLVCTEGPPPGSEVELYFDDSDRPYKLRKALQYDREFQKFRIVNTTGQAQSFELQISEPGNRVIDRSYVGQELALNGDLHVPGSPQDDSGGSVKTVGGSWFSYFVNNPGATDTQTIIDPTLNVRGARIRFCRIEMFSNLHGYEAYLYVTPANAVLAVTREAVDQLVVSETFHLEANQGLYCRAAVGNEVRFQCSYDYL